MPKASLASTDAYESKMGFQEGWFEVAEASVQVFQFPPNKTTGKQADPMLAQILMVFKTDSKGVRESDEPLELNLKIEGDLTKARPGQAKSREDNDPKDLGAEVGTTGNCIYIDSEDYKINAKNRIVMFNKSLEEQGFDPKILKHGFSPDYIGLIAHGKTVKGEKFTTREGTEGEASWFVVDKILKHPAKTAGKVTPITKPSATGKAKPTVPVPATPMPTAEPEPSEIAGASDAETSALVILASIAADKTDGLPVPLQKLKTMAYSRLISNKQRDKNLDKEVQDLFKNSDWLENGAMENGWEFDLKEQTFTFGEAS